MDHLYVKSNNNLAPPISMSNFSMSKNAENFKRLKMSQALTRQKKAEKLSPVKRALLNDPTLQTIKRFREREKELLKQEEALSDVRKNEYLRTINTFAIQKAPASIEEKQNRLKMILKPSNSKVLGGTDSRSKFSITQSKSLEKQSIQQYPKKFSQKTLMDMTHSFKLGHRSNSTDISYNVKTDLVHPAAPSYSIGVRYSNSFQKEPSPGKLDVSHVEKHLKAEKQKKSKNMARLEGIVSFNKMKGRPQFENETPEQIASRKEARAEFLRNFNQEVPEIDHSKSKTVPFSIQISRERTGDKKMIMSEVGIYDVNWKFVRPSSQCTVFKTGDFNGPFRKSEFGSFLDQTKPGVLIRKKKQVK